MLLTDEEQTALIDAPRLAVRNESLPSRRRSRSESDEESEVETGSGGRFRSRRVQAIVALGAIIVLLIGLFAWSPWKSSAPLIAVPKVAGLAADAAKANLEQAGFSVKQTKEPSSDIAEGLATRTAPGDDVPTPKGSEVTLYISSGPQRQPMPDLRGKSPNDAKKELSVLGFTDVKVEDTDSTMGLKGKVVRTNVRTGQSSPVNARVILYVGTGPKEITLPDLRRQTREEASTTLKGLDLDMVTVEVDSELPAGQVVSTSPEPGSTVEVNGTIQVQISRGNMFVVPNLRGKSVADAQKALEDAGWEANTLTQRDRNVGLTSKDDGKVVAQTPSAGSKLRKNQSVEVVVGRASLIPG